jgi:hypothetical protein
MNKAPIHGALFHVRGASMSEDSSRPPKRSDMFTAALRKIATVDAASSRAAIEASKLTKPSRHTRFVYDPAKARE